MVRPSGERHHLMSWSYTGPASSNRDWVRFKVGDTQSRGYLLEDGEIDYLLSEASSRENAVIPAVDAMIAKCSQRVTYSSGAESEDLGDRLKQLRQLRADLVDQGYADTRTVAGSGVQTLTRLGDTSTEYTL